MDEDELVGLAAAMEARSEHPLAAAVVAAARERSLELAAPEAFESVTGQGVLYGIWTTSTYQRLGSSTVGGNGSAPATPFPTPSVATSAMWADGVDDDLDGSADEETFNGIDDDLDGKVDEDNDTFPTNADVALGLPVGTLKALAISQGHYDTDAVALGAYITTHGGMFPSGAVVYVEPLVMNLAVGLGTVFNPEPSILVVHDAAGTSEFKANSGRFRGVIYCDSAKNINADFQMYGAIIAFRQDTDHSFGNGNAMIRYSSEALAMLPVVTVAGANLRPVSWSRSAVSSWDDAWGDVLAP